MSLDSVTKATISMHPGPLTSEWICARGGATQVSSPGYLNPSQGKHVAATPGEVCAQVAAGHEQKPCVGASLVAQWLRICLPIQGTRVRALVWEDPTCRGATKPVRHHY